MWGHPSDQETILFAAEMPALILSGWRNPCPASWSVAGLTGARQLMNTRSHERQVAAAFLGLIAIQWLFLGASPRQQARRWYAEPGALITVCLIIAAVPLLPAPILWVLHRQEFPHVPAGLGILARLPILVIIPAWLLWLISFIWKSFAFAWKKTRRFHPRIPARS
jgi:hypothetical protein